MQPHTRSRSGIRRRFSAFSPLSPTTPRCINTKYQLGEELGSGAFGTVFKAVDVHRGTIVALKRIHTANLLPEEIADVEDEVKILRTLEHPNVVRYIESYRDDQHLYVALDYAEGGSLAGLVKPTRCGPLSEDLAALYIEQALKGLDYLHKNQVIHRDVKGANILLTKDGNVKIADFGISRRLQTGDRANTMAGTANFISPEVISGQGASSASDIWAIGATLIELLTGKPPYANTREPMAVLFRIMEDRHPPFPRDGSKHLKAFLGACFRKDPAERPSAEELLDYAWIKKAQYMRVLHQSASDFSNARMKRAIQQGLSDGLTGIPKTPEQCQEVISTRRHSGSSIPEDEGSEEASDGHAQVATSKTTSDILTGDDYITPEQLQVLREHLEKYLSKKKIVRLRPDRSGAESGQHPSFATAASLRSGSSSNGSVDYEPDPVKQESMPNNRSEDKDRQRERKEGGQTRCRESRKESSPGGFHSDAHVLSKVRGKSRSSNDLALSSSKSKADDAHQRNHKPKHNTLSENKISPSSVEHSKDSARKDAIAQWRRQLWGKPASSD